MGMLQFRQDRADLAIATLTQSYRANDLPERREQRINAASVLASVMRELGDYKQALALNSEVIEWNASHGETLQLSVARYLRGIILLDMREFDAATLAFENARALSVAIGDEQGVAYSDMRMRESQIELAEIVEARGRCENAYRIFAAARSPDTIKQTLAHLARIELAEGKAGAALAKLDTVLANDAEDMPPRQVTPLFKHRAQANEALGRHRQAYADLRRIRAPLHGHERGAPRAPGGCAARALRGRPRDRTQRRAASRAHGLEGAPGGAAALDGDRNRRRHAGHRVCSRTCWSSRAPIAASSRSSPTWTHSPACRTAAAPATSRPPRSCAPSRRGSRSRPRSSILDHFKVINDRCGRRRRRPCVARVRADGARGIA